MEAVKLGKRERNRIANRNAILSAARDCFRDIGYDRVTIREIIRRTDLAAGTFYNYFTDKQDIFSALLTDFLGQINDNLKDLRQHARREEDFVYQTYLALFRASAADPVIYELAHRNEQTIKELFGSDILGLAMSSLEDDVRDAARRGMFRNIDAQYLSAAFFGVAYEMCLRVARRANTDGCDPEGESRRAAQFACDLFMGGIERMIRYQDTEENRAASRVESDH